MKTFFEFLFVLLTAAYHLTKTFAIEQYGPYEVASRNLYTPSQRAVMVFPKQILSRDNTDKFPVIVLTHGAFAGGLKTYRMHKGFLDGLASFGFIVSTPKGCNLGCLDFAQTMLNHVDFIDSSVNHRIFQFADRDVGYGLIGHSYGGAFGAIALAFAEEHKITAGVILHPAPPSGLPNITVPTAVFTGSLDTCCGERTAKPAIYDKIDGVPKAFASMIGIPHPELYFRTQWTAYTAAWFQVYLNNDTDVYYDLIYGNSTSSLCGSELPMTDSCEALR